MAFEKTDVKTMEMKPFEKIGSEWMLITGEKDGKVNTMTASWGGVGVLWGKNVATVYIRPQRYTKEFVDENDTFTISFFDGNHMKELGYLGKTSGRQVPDKIDQSGLHVEMAGGHASFEEASQVLVCKKLYSDTIKPENFYNNEEDTKWYPEKDYHVMYIAEIVEAYQK
ncbi:MAG: flavin reductase family protein [Clostridia bacterium]|nr:flavin reductase family protein [Clostridia bacterium]NCC42286.1 flavin reductase family protein [Clostridia bacterium]